MKHSRIAFITTLFALLAPAAIAAGGDIGKASSPVKGSFSPPVRNSRQARQIPGVRLPIVAKGKQNVRAAAALSQILNLPHESHRVRKPFMSPWKPSASTFASLPNNPTTQRPNDPTTRFLAGGGPGICGGAGG